MIDKKKHKNKYGRTTTLSLNVFYTLSITTFLFSFFCYFKIGVKGVILNSLLIYSILNTLNIVYFYLHKNILKSYNIASILGYTTIIVIALHSGGIISPALSFLVLFIFFGYLIKKFYGNLWFVIVVITLLFFYVMNKNAYPFINELNENNITEFNVLFLLFSIILLGGVFGRLINKTNEDIKRAKIEIEKRNDEKTVMLKEIHHRVKNNLQVVNSLLRIQARGIDDLAIKSMFTAAQNRVITMARLHEKVYNTKDLKNINVNEHFKMLISDLVDSNNLGKDISTELQIDDIVMSIDQLLPLSLIINELISNSLKHAFIDVNGGVISVKLFKLNDSKCRLLISDNGLGSKEEILSKSFNSTGITLVKTFVRQLNGEIESLNTHTGTMFEITFIKD
ncbi:sensor histidine kinase [Flavobacteriaceae bacterium]|nr:sensor histidine kinase [Flavobacteriaceae bacterium]